MRCLHGSLEHGGQCFSPDTNSSSSSTWSWWNRNQIGIESILIPSIRGFESDLSDSDSRWVRLSLRIAQTVLVLAVHSVHEDTWLAWEAPKAIFWAHAFKSGHGFRIHHMATLQTRMYPAPHRRILRIPGTARICFSFKTRFLSKEKQNLLLFQKKSSLFERKKNTRKTDRKPWNHLPPV